MIRRLYDEANLKMREGNEDEAYVLVWRCCEVSDRLIKKTDFAQFKRHPVRMYL